MDFVYTFKDDEAGYLDWVRRFKHGYVLNADRTPRAEYLILHRSTCGTITGKPARGEAWTKDFIKICSMSKSDLRDWAMQTTGGVPQPCGTCAP